SLFIFRLPSAYLLYVCFRDTATTGISTLSLHDALPISVSGVSRPSTRKYGWFPTFRCKSEDLFSTARRSRSSTLVGIVCKPRKRDRKSTRLNSSHVSISYAVFCLKKKKYTYNSDIHD